MFWCSRKNVGSITIIFVVIEGCVVMSAMFAPFFSRPSRLRANAYRNILHAHTRTHTCSPAPAAGGLLHLRMITDLSKCYHHCYKKYQNYSTVDY